MNQFWFLLGNLLRTIDSRSGSLFIVLILLIFSSGALFSSFFLLGTPTPDDTGPSLSADEVFVHLSPRLSQQKINDLYLKIRESEDVSQINYRYPQEFGLEAVEGLLVIKAVSVAKVTGLVDALSAIDGIATVDSLSTRHADSLSAPVKIGLLIGLALSIVGSLIAARYAFAELLKSFSEEIRMMRLAGTAEQVIQPPIVAIGALCGIIAGLLLIVAIYLLRFLAITHPGFLLHATSGWVDPARVLTVSLGGFLLGLVLGGLVGALGASLTESSKFQVYS
jgi:cell division protein FtsX